MGREKRKSTTGMTTHGETFGFKEFPAARIQDLRSGDEEALQDFYWAFVESLYRFVYYRTGKDHYVTEEIVQQTFISAVRALPDYRGEGSLFGWLKGIAVRRTADHFRRHRAELPLSSALNALDRDYRALLDELERESLSQTTCTQEHVRDLVHATMSTIPPVYAKVLGLKYVEGHSVGAIAEMIGRTTKAAESILTRARDAFRTTFNVLLEDLAGEQT
jgi:RNA polymerase sigma-70 factor (ECF subfamily)